VTSPGVVSRISNWDPGALGPAVATPIMPLARSGGPSTANHRRSSPAPQEALSLLGQALCFPTTTQCASQGRLGRVPWGTSLRLSVESVVDWSGIALRQSAYAAGRLCSQSWKTDPDCVDESATGMLGDRRPGRPDWIVGRQGARLFCASGKEEAWGYYGRAGPSGRRFSERSTLPSSALASSSRSWILRT